MRVAVDWVMVVFRELGPRAETGGCYRSGVIDGAQ